MRAPEILETCVYAEDLVAAEGFYRDVLGLAPIARVEGRHVFFRCGARVFLVFNPATTGDASSPVPAHGCRGPGHAAFAIPDRELPRWREHLERSGVTVERELSWPRGGRSLYFRDPAGNSIELATPEVWGIHESEIFAPKEEGGRRKR
jgi:catechol 2,3-dioxygenase-like lactoylglutathione lyase family enzyme